MNRNIFYNTFIIIVLAFGCHKVELDPADGNPVFSAEAMLDGEPKLWQAGVDDYYMFSSFEKDALDVYTFIGELAKTDSCCGPSIAFHFRDLVQRNSKPVDITESLDRDFTYADMTGSDTIWVTVTDTVWLANFDASQSILPQGLAPAYLWSFGDGVSGNSSNPGISHTYDSLNDSTTVRLDVVAGSACSSFLQRPLFSNSPSQDCNLDFNWVADTSGITITAQVIGVQPFSYLWSNFSTSSQLNIPLDSINSSNVSVSVTVTDANGCVVQGGISTTYIPGTPTPVCLARFTHTLSPVLVDSTYISHIIPTDSLMFSKFTVVYDSDGIEYRSDRQSQPAASQIRILDVEEYDLNEKGDKTKKLRLNFNCRVWNVVGEFIDIEDGEAVIAVAY